MKSCWQEQARTVLRESMSKDGQRFLGVSLNQAWSRAPEREQNLSPPAIRLNQSSSWEDDEDGNKGASSLYSLLSFLLLPFSLQYFFLYQCLLIAHIHMHAPSPPEVSLPRACGQRANRKLEEDLVGSVFKDGKRAYEQKPVSPWSGRATRDSQSCSFQHGIILPSLLLSIHTLGCVK